MQKPVTHPRYQMLADLLRQRIGNGEYKPGDRLPSESELCVEHGVSRGTVVRAIEQLVLEGVVHRRQGAGSFVARPSLRRRAGNLLSFSESAAGEGMRSTQSLLSIEMATEDLVREFQCGGPAIYLRRLRNVDGLPCAVHRSMIPMHVARNVEALSGMNRSQLESPDFSLYGALEKAGYSVCEAHERVTTRLAGAEEKALLNIEKHAPVMVVFRRSYDAFGRLVEVVEAVYHGEYYTFDIQLVSSSNPESGAQEAKIYSLGGRMVHPRTKHGE
ncbi:GntR family transcriptional regulator [Oricola sp.]|uniref:GntR family transcriptional regulator n=1 Tax=Oricola sp. TaxID=1979950 RepID=UPI003BAB8ADB